MNKHIYVYISTYVCVSVREGDVSSITVGAFVSPPPVEDRLCISLLFLALGCFYFLFFSPSITRFVLPTQGQLEDCFQPPSVLPDAPRFIVRAAVRACAFVYNT